MAGRDNVLFRADIASGTAAGTVVPLSLAYGIENVRQGYGKPTLKSVRSFWYGLYNNAEYGVPVEIKNSNWIDSAGVIAQVTTAATVYNRDSLAFMRGRDKELAPNTSWTIAATLPAATTVAGSIYVLFEIEYSDVAGVSTEKVAGSPVMKMCSNGSVTAAANTPTTIGAFDNLLQDTKYMVSEVSVIAPIGTASPFFVVMEGFSNQRGLVRIFPAKSTGMTDQIEGSVVLTKQTYNLSVISYSALSSAAVQIGLELIADKN